MKRLLLSVALVAVLAGPAFAQRGDHDRPSPYQVPPPAYDNRYAVWHDLLTMQQLVEKLAPWAALGPNDIRRITYDRALAERNSLIQRMAGVRAQRAKK